MVQVLEALGAAHAAGIIHRDLKPDNIFVIPSKAGTQQLRQGARLRRLEVLAARRRGDEHDAHGRGGRARRTTCRPSRPRPSPVDQRTDIYAMGVLLFQATTGQVPFDAATFNELLFKIVLEPAPLPQQLVPDLDAEFSGIIQKAMAREPGGRFQSCAEFKNALLAWAAARPSLALLTTGRTSFPRLSLPSQPETATPPPTRTEPPWGGQHGQGPAVPGMGQTPQLTANSWGASSGVTGRSTRPPSRMPLLAAIAGAASLFGAGVAVWLVFGHSGTTGAATAGQGAVSATAIPAPSPSSPAPPTEPIVTASATVAEPAPPVTAEPVAAPTASSARAKPLLAAPTASPDEAVARHEAAADGPVDEAEHVTPEAAKAGGTGRLRLPTPAPRRALGSERAAQPESGRCYVGGDPGGARGLWLGRQLQYEQRHAAGEQHATADEAGPLRSSAVTQHRSRAT